MDLNKTRQIAQEIVKVSNDFVCLKPLVNLFFLQYCTVLCDVTIVAIFFTPLL